MPILGLFCKKALIGLTKRPKLGLFSHDPLSTYTGGPKKSHFGGPGGSGCGRVGLFCPFWLFLGLIRHLEPILGLAWASLTLISIIAHSLGPLGGTRGVRGGQQICFIYFLKLHEMARKYNENFFGPPLHPQNGHFWSQILNFGGHFRHLLGVS